jgi:radical SAM superfamily enzyme YgiQ (UPF0313 family)
MSLALRHHYQQLLDRESGYPLAPPTSPLSFAVCYPNTYFVGMSNLGVHAVYRLLSERCGLRPERAFLPDPLQRGDFESSRTPLFSLETQQDLSSFHVLGFSLQFEEDYPRVVTMLRLAGVPVRSADREDGDPLVLAGGPCATYNPLPLADLVDAFVIGDAEPVLPKLIARLEQCTTRGGVLSRQEALAALVEVDGVFVPSPAWRMGVSRSANDRLTGKRPTDAYPPGGTALPGEACLQRQVHKHLDDFPAHTMIFTDDTEFSRMNLIEVGRGCLGGCRFCVTGHAFRPRRALSPDTVLDLARRGASFSGRVGLVGPSVSDLPHIEEVCERLTEEGLTFSLPSMRLDSLSDRLLRAMVKGGQREITLAPEAGTERLRRLVAKRTSEEQIADCVARARAAGIESVRLYFLLGLPTETDADAQEVAQLARRLRDGTKIRQLELSVSVFVPKPMTPFEHEAMPARPVLERRVRELQSALGREKGIEVKLDSVRWAFVQALLARGGRDLGEAIVEAEAGGATLGAWRNALAGVGVDLWRAPTQPATDGPASIG